MEQVVGRAGFHVEHAKNVGERGAIVHEMMRELDDESIAYWATRNPNIVVADEPLNEAMVNGGGGGFRRCTDRQEVLDYGAERVRRVKRKFTEDRPDPKTGKPKGGTVTTTLIVAHLPKSMCIEVPDFYPVVDKDTGEPVLDVNGDPRMRSRWVARDRDEARRYFEDLIAYLADVAIPDGLDGVLGYDIQHSESTPHVQIIADTFAPDPKDDESLRVETSRYWFSHRDIRDENGRQKTGRAKMRDYHVGLKEHLLDLGYDISPDFDEDRHMVGMGKDEYGQVMDAQRDIQDRGVAVRTRETNVKAAEKTVKNQEASAQVRQSLLDEREGILDQREADLPRLKAKAVTEGREEGLATAEQRIQLEVEREVEQRLGERLGPALLALRREHQDLMEQARSAKAKYVAAAEAYAGLADRMRPAVEKWEQANPHTERGRASARQLEIHKSFEDAAEAINGSVLDSDFGDG